MKIKAEVKEVFNNERGILSNNKLIPKIAILVIVILLGIFVAPTFVQAQRLCEHNDNPIATISPCFGSSGTIINIKPGRKLSSAPGNLVFKRVLTNGVPSEVLAKISSNNTIAAPPQLCTAGSGRWEVWLVLANGQSQGKIGAYWSYSCVGGSSTGLGGKDESGNNKNKSPSNETIVLPPITINVDNEVDAKTKSTSQSYIKNISSTQPSIATGTEWGTNEVKIYGKKAGTTTISFLDDNTGTIYQVEVTVKVKSPNGAGDGKGEVKKPAAGESRKIDKCLIGHWEGVSLTLLKGLYHENWTGFRVTFKSDGTEIVDYSAMKPFVYEDKSILSFEGTATAKISTDNHVATIESIDQHNVTRTVVNIPMKLPSLGPGGLGTTTDINSYTCTEETLEYKSSSAHVNPEFSVKLRRLENDEAEGATREKTNEEKKTTPPNTSKTKEAVEYFLRDFFSGADLEDFYGGLMESDPDLVKSLDLWAKARKKYLEQKEIARKARLQAEKKEKEAKLSKEIEDRMKNGTYKPPEGKEAKTLEQLQKESAADQKAAEEAKEKAKTETDKEKAEEKVLKEAEKNVDPNIRDKFEKAEEKAKEKAKQEKVIEKKPN